MYRPDETLNELRPPSMTAVEELISELEAQMFPGSRNYSFIFLNHLPIYHN